MTGYLLSTMLCDGFLAGTSVIRSSDDGFSNGSNGFFDELSLVPDGFPLPGFFASAGQYLSCICCG